MKRFSWKQTVAVTKTIRRTKSSMGFIGLVGLMNLASLVGCGPTAYKITPVPVDRTLEETVLINEGGWMPAKIALIDVEGVLIDTHKPTFFGEGENPVSLFLEKLDKAAKDSSVRAIVLRINSPGGGVTASDLMYQELLEFKRRTDNKKPVVAILMDVAASGGFYLACGADRIVAQPTSVTGSIGVIMQLFSLSGTMDKIGVETTAIKSGTMKDAGSPFKKLKPEEQKIFQSIVDQFYDRFVEVVAKGRPNLSAEQVRKIADGRVWSAPQALELGLIDQIGTLRDVLADVKSKIDARRVRVVMYHRPLGWRPNIYAETPAGPPQMNMVNIQFPASWAIPQAQFMYLWAPGM
ncbi:MAG: signal peptide peptidase SppA [Phycisphaerae bacterium]|nr:signal peptide peptidase SppA [Phycisphaerae bacterium]